MTLLCDNQSFGKHLLSTYYVPDPGLESEVAKGTKKWWDSAEDIETLKRTQCDWQMACCSPISHLLFLTTELSQPLWVSGADGKREAGILRGQEERIKAVTGGMGGSSF